MAVSSQNLIFDVHLELIVWDSKILDFILFKISFHYLWSVVIFGFL